MWSERAKKKLEKMILRITDATEAAFVRDWMTRLEKTGVSVPNYVDWGPVRYRDKDSRVWETKVAWNGEAGDLVSLRVSHETTKIVFVYNCLGHDRLIKETENKLCAELNENLSFIARYVADLKEGKLDSLVE